MRLVFLVMYISIFSSCSTITSNLLGHTLFMSDDDLPFNQYPKVIYLISDTSKCVFTERIAPVNKMWKPGVPNITNDEVDRLKTIAGRRGYNSISNVIIRDSNNPLGEADAYICPEDIYRKNSQYQNDKVFFDKVVKIID